MWTSDVEVFAGSEDFGFRSVSDSMFYGLNVCVEILMPM